VAAPAQHYTYDDLLAMPEDDLRREIIHGELFVTPAPVPRHALAAQFLALELGLYQRAHGGLVFSSAVDLYLAHDSVVIPDAVYFRPEHVDRVGDRNLQGPADLVVEISSPSTRRRDRTLKRDLYAEYGAAEYWFVDLHADQVEVWRPRGGVAGDPLVLRPGDTLTSPVLPGFAVPVDGVLGRG
jgi:Uma2 family endonuclease